MVPEYKWVCFWRGVLKLRLSTFSETPGLAAWLWEINTEQWNKWCSWHCSRGSVNYWRHKGPSGLQTKADNQVDHCSVLEVGPLTPGSAAPEANWSRFHIGAVDVKTDVHRRILTSTWTFNIMPNWSRPFFDVIKKSCRQHQKKLTSLSTWKPLELQVRFHPERHGSGGANGLNLRGTLGTRSPGNFLRLMCSIHVTSHETTTIDLTCCFCDMLLMPEFPTRGVGKHTWLSGLPIFHFTPHISVPNSKGYGSISTVRCVTGVAVDIGPRDPETSGVALPRGLRYAEASVVAAHSGLLFLRPWVCACDGFLTPGTYLSTGSMTGTGRPGPLVTGTWGTQASWFSPL